LHDLLLLESTHPSWKCSSSGQDLLDRVEVYRRRETAALTREQELHIAVAAHELEVLAALEHKQNNVASTLPFQLFEEYQNKKPQTTSEAGVELLAGSMQHTASNQVSNMFASQSHESATSDHPNDDPPPFVVPHSNLASQPNLASISPPHVSGSTLTTGRRSAATHIGLSVELRRLLNMSTLDPEVSMLGAASSDDDERRTERQYVWLERYHAHIEAQQGQQHDHSLALDESRSSEHDQPRETDVSMV
jgi:hypothetical protein